MPGIPCPPWARSHGSGGAPAHLGSGLAHGSMQSDAGGGGGGGGPGGSALGVSATIRPSPESRANTAATMRVLMVAPRSRFRPARCRFRPGSSRGRTRRSWRRCRAGTGLTWNGATVGSASAGPAADKLTEAILTTRPPSKQLNLIEFSHHRPSLVGVGHSTRSPVAVRQSSSTILHVPTGDGARPSCCLRRLPALPGTSNNTWRVGAVDAGERGRELAGTSFPSTAACTAGRSAS
jgi:hypothetical protein